LGGCGGTPRAGADDDDDDDDNDDDGDDGNDDNGDEAWGGSALGGSRNAAMCLAADAIDA